MAHFGYRNNNPGNIRPNAAFTWQGQTGAFDAGKSGKFLIFDTMVNGMRAVARLVANYPAIFGVDTMRGFFAKYAPTGDGANDPAAYAKMIANAVGVGIDAKVDFTDYGVVSRMLLPIFRVETGENPLDNGITAEMVREACLSAGNVKNVPMKPGYVQDDGGNIKRDKIEDSRTIKNADQGTKEAGVGIIGTLAGMVAAIANAPWYVSAPLAAIAAVAIGFVVYRLVIVKKLRVEDNEMGVR